MDPWLIWEAAVSQEPRKRRTGAGTWEVRHISHTHQSGGVWRKCTPRRRTLVRNIRDSPDIAPPELTHAEQGSSHSSHTAPSPKQAALRVRMLLRTADAFFCISLSVFLVHTVALPTAEAVQLAVDIKMRWRLRILLHCVLPTRG